MHVLDVKKILFQTGHLPLYQNYNVDHPPLPRQNNDATIDSRGRSLNELYIGNQLNSEWQML